MRTFKFLKSRSSFSIVILIVCILILLFFSFLFYQRFDSFTQYSNSTSHTYRVIEELSYTESIIKDVETGTRGYIITHDTNFLEPVERSKKLIQPALDSLKKLVTNNPEQINNLTQVKRLVDLQLKNSEAAKRYFMFNGLQKDSLYIQMLYNKKIMDEYRVLTAKMIKNETELLGEREQKMNYFQNLLPHSFTLIFISALLICLAFGIWTFIEFDKRLMYQKSLEENIIQLYQNNSELEQIAFAASHDLQEPLRKIRIYSEKLKMVADNTSNNEIGDISEKINRSAVQLHGLIADLVELNTLIQSAPEISTIELAKLVSEVERMYASTIAFKQCKVIKSELPAVKGSYAQLKVVFSNLFSNSLHFISQQQKPLIIISAEKVIGQQVFNLPYQLRQKNYIHIAFKDNGIGFDENYSDKLFLPFQRLHNYEEHELKRKGMGLAICKRIMINIGGWIYAEGKENLGATIHLYFPE